MNAFQTTVTKSSEHKNNLYDYFRNALSITENFKIITMSEQYLYNDLDTFSGKIATYFKKIGIEPGDRIVVHVEKSEFNLFLYLGCLRAGIIYVPLNSTYSSDELRYFIEDSAPKMIICNPEKETIIRKIKHSDNCMVMTLDESGDGSFYSEINKLNGLIIHEIEQMEADDVAVILYTSGTTGKPKGAMITHGALLENALNLNECWGINAKDTILHMLPFFHVHGLFFALHTALLSGASLFFLPKFNIDHFFSYIDKSTVFMGVPTYYSRLLNDDRLTKKICKKTRLFISGSAPLLASTFDEFYKKTEHTLLERYGMTETGIISSNPLYQTRKVGTVGKPLSQVDVRVVNENMQILNAGETGHIEVKGKNLFKGYWNNPEKTKEEFTQDGYFKTGDVGSFDSQGYLSIVGRSKDMIITGGLNVYPKELEHTINTIEGVIESAVIGVNHPNFGEAVVAVIARNSEKVRALDVTDFLKHHHAGYKCPKKVFFVDALPKNTMGKIQKNLLREKFKNVFKE